MEVHPAVNRSHAGRPPRIAAPMSQAVTAPSWRSIITPRPAHRRTRGGRWTTAGIVCVILGSLILSLPLLLLLAVPAPAPTRTGGAGPDTAMLRRAADYDKRLLKDGTMGIGEAADPFTGGSKPAYETDRDYQGQLDPGADMATISIPGLSIRLPIGHGTSQATLETGAGHIYGTTLPVGDPGNTVIAAHRGLGARLLFYRLGELRAGDLVYTQAAGRTVAWRVDRMGTVDPGSKKERDALALGDGATTRLTLYTCDPPGLNTRRLIIGAHRVPYNPGDRAGKGRIDPLPFLAAGGLTGVTALTVMLVIAPRTPISHHSDGAGKGRPKGA